MFGFCLGGLPARFVTTGRACYLPIPSVPFLKVVVDVGVVVVVGVGVNIVAIAGACGGGVGAVAVGVGVDVAAAADAVVAGDVFVVIAVCMKPFLPLTTPSAPRGPSCP